MLHTNDELTLLIKSGRLERISRLSADSYLVLWRDDKEVPAWLITLFDPNGVYSCTLERVADRDCAFDTFESTYLNIQGK